MSQSKSPNAPKSAEVPTAARLQRAVELSPLAFAVTNAGGGFLEVNAALTRWSGHDSDGLLQLDLFDITDPSYHEELKSFLDETHGKGRSEPRHLLFRKESGKRVWGLALGSALDLHQIDSELVVQILDIEEPKKVYEEFTSEQEFNNLMADASPDLIFVKDADFRIVRANAAFLALYPGRTAAEIIGTTTVEDYLPHEAEQFLQQDRLAFAQGRTTTLERLRTPDGKTRLLRTTKIRFEDTDGNAFILGTAHDVTEREKLIEQLRRTNEDLDQFAYVASHDLRSPLSAIEKIVRWIEQDCAEILPAASKDHLALLRSRVTRLDQLLSDLLQYSRIGRERQQTETVPLKELVGDVCRILDIPKQFVVSSDEAEVSLPIIPAQLILRNLISNAIKHHDTDHGSIEVSFLGTPDQQTLIVADDGPGIPAELQEKAMKLFETLQPRDDVEGSGMGLSIARKAAESFGGTLSIDPEFAEGTRVLLRWPREPVSSSL